MKNFIQHICKKNRTFIVLFLLAVSVNGQLQFANLEEQRLNLEGAMKSYFLNFDNQSFTIAAMQIPNSNVFLIASSSPNIDANQLYPSMVKEVLTTFGFQDPWNRTGDSNEPMEIIFVTASSQSTVGFVDYIGAEPGVSEGFNIIKLPSRAGVHLHAEMAIISALEVYYNDIGANVNNTLIERRPNFVIQSSREFCPRCYGYLLANTFHVPALNLINVQGDDFASTISWSPPNYNIGGLGQDLQGYWPAIMRAWTNTYVGNFGAFLTGNNTLLHTINNVTPLPINRGATQLY